MVGEVFAGDLERVTLHAVRPVVDPDGAAAERLDVVHAVRAQQQSSARRAVASSHLMHFFWKDSSPTARTSSVMSRSGSSAAAIANPSRTTMPDE
jgi:hypothetical protein